MARLSADLYQEVISRDPALLEHPEVVAWLEPQHKIPIFNRSWLLPGHIQELLGFTVEVHRVGPDVSYLAMVDEIDIVREVLLMTQQGCYRRNDARWIPLDSGDDESEGGDNFDDLVCVDATPAFLSLFDSASISNGRITRDTIR